MGGMPGNSGRHPAPTRCQVHNQTSVSLEHPTLTSQKVWRGRLLHHPGPPRCQQCSDHHPLSGPKSLQSSESLTGSDMLFTCLDLKNAFFFLRLSPASQPLFAFEWDDPQTGKKTQLTWTRLPQGFKNPPTQFGEHLAMDLAAFPGEILNCTPLQHEDDLLLASPTQGTFGGTRALLALLSTTGHKVPWKKAQICRQEVKYLGFVISKGHRALGHEGKQAICSIPRLNTKKEVREWGCWILLNVETGFL